MRLKYQQEVERSLFERVCVSLRAGAYQILTSTPAHVRFQVCQGFTDAIDCAGPIVAPWMPAETSGLGLATQTVILRSIGHINVSPLAPCRINLFQNASWISRQRPSNIPLPPPIVGNKNAPYSCAWERTANSAALPSISQIFPIGGLYAFFNETPSGENNARFIQPLLTHASPTELGLKGLYPKQEPTRRYWLELTMFFLEVWVPTPMGSVYGLFFPHILKMDGLLQLKKMSAWVCQLFPLGNGAYLDESGFFMPAPAGLKLATIHYHARRSPACLQFSRQPQSGIRIGRNSLWRIFHYPRTGRCYYRRRGVHRSFYTILPATMWWMIGCALLLHKDHAKGV
jgi:hypothetical protein